MNWFVAVQLIQREWHFVASVKFAALETAIKELAPVFCSFEHFQPTAWAVHQVTSAIAETLEERKKRGDTLIEGQLIPGLQSVYKMPRREPTQFRNEQMGEFYNTKLGEPYAPPPRFKEPKPIPRMIDQP